jgi:hypothetical protein
MSVREKRISSRGNLRELAGKVERQQHFYLRMIEQHFRPGQPMHVIPGRPRLVSFRFPFYPAYLFYLFSLRFVELREILCALTQKSPSTSDGFIHPAASSSGRGFSRQEALTWRIPIGSSSVKIRVKTKHANELGVWIYQQI